MYQLQYVWVTTEKDLIPSCFESVMYPCGAPTMIRDLPRAPLQQKPHPATPSPNQLDGSGVGHVTCALPVNLDDLVPDLRRVQQPCEPSAETAPSRDC